jgi:hypothetical protein
MQVTDLTGREYFAARKEAREAEQTVDTDADEDALYPEFPLSARPRLVHPGLVDNGTIEPAVASP